MNLREARRLQVGDKILAPDVGVKIPIPIVGIYPDRDPRIQLLFELNGHPYRINYKHLRRVANASKESG